jgi:hypothetical protein
VDGVAERYAKGWPVMPKSTRVTARPAPAEVRQELVCGWRIGCVPIVGGDARAGEASPGTSRG